MKGKHGRAKGGIVIVIKESISRGVKIIQSIDCFALWLKFDKLCYKNSPNIAHQNGPHSHEFSH